MTPVTSSSSSRWNRKTGLGPPLPASGVTSWWRPSASTTSVIWSPSGLVPWSLDRPGLTSGFVPKEIAPELDFIAVHLYPEKGKVKEAMETLSGLRRGEAGGH